MGVKLPAFQRLVDDHWQDVARLAHALAGPSLGDDVAQQAWARALAAYGQLRSASNLRSWLLTITANCATDVFRSAQREAVPIADLAELGELGQRAGPALVPGWSGSSEWPGSPGWSGAVAAGVTAEDAGDPLWVAVRQLPERPRTAIALRYIADLDHAQIAKALGITSAASRRLVSDALGVLRAQLDLRPAPELQEEVR